MLARKSHAHTLALFSTCTPRDRSHLQNFSLVNPQTEGTTGTVEKREVMELCDAGSEEWTIAIGNEPSDTQSAAAISAEQVKTRPTTLNDTTPSCVRHGSLARGDLDGEVYSILYLSPPPSL